MKQIVYRSFATRKYDRIDLIRLMSAARKFNAQNSLTGVLLFHQGQFAQCLEGPVAGIDRVWERIMRDHSHHDIVLLQDLPIQERSFGRWLMACTEVTDQQWLELDKQSWLRSEHAAISPGLVTMQAIWATYSDSLQDL